MDAPFLNDGNSTSTIVCMKCHNRETYGNGGTAEAASRWFDLDIVPGRPGGELERYLRNGGRLLISGTMPPESSDAAA